MRALIKVLKAVSDKNRMRILKMLGKKKMCVCEIAAVLDITQPSVSKHLSILREADLIIDERNQQWIDYSLCEDTLNKYAPVLQTNIRKWLNDDPVVKNDIKCMKLMRRESFCKK